MSDDKKTWLIVLSTKFGYVRGGGGAYKYQTV